MNAKKKSSAKIKVAIIILLLLIIVVGIWFYKSLIKYSDTHRWATIQVYGSVMSETADEFDECKEVLKGDTYQLHNTVVVIENITTAGEVTLKFEPAVINIDTGELAEMMVIDREDILNIKEVCNDGDSATWQFRVISNRYQ